MKPFHPAGNPSLGFIADMRKMRLQLVGGRAVQCGQIARQQCHKGVYVKSGQRQRLEQPGLADGILLAGSRRSEEHTSELPSLMRISYAVFCLKKKTKKPLTTKNTQQ